MMSRKAMEMNNAPENVIAMFIISLSSKHFKAETNLPKITTSKKNAIISPIFIIVIVSIFFLFLDIIKYNGSFFTFGGNVGKSEVDKLQNDLA